MAEENTSDIKEIEFTCGTNTLSTSEEVSVVTDEGNAEDFISVASKTQEEILIPEINEVSKPDSATLRRHSTGTIGARATKPQVQSRYRGNHRVGSTHDLCKHGKKRCEEDDAVKPWKMVRRKSVEGSDLIKAETRKSLGSVSRVVPGSKLESSLAAKRDALAVRRKPCGSVNSDSSSKEGSVIVRSVDGLSVKSNDRAISGSAAIKKVPGLRNENSSTAKVFVPKNLKKVKTQTISGEDVKEKTVCVVESSVKSVQKEKKASPEKKTMSGHKSSTTPKRGSSPTDSTKKKEAGSVDLEANPKPEKKNRSKRSGVKVTLAHQLSFKKGNVLEPKPEDSSPKWIKFRKRVVQELKTQTEGKKKNLKDKGLGVESKTDYCEGSKREKVVLRQQKVEEKKKKITLFNNVIEETVNKLTKVRKDKVKALIGAFETVISLQDTMTSHKAQSKATTSASKVRPLASQQ